MLGEQQDVGNRSQSNNPSGTDVSTKGNKQSKGVWGEGVN